MIITYEMSRKIANTSWLQLAFSAALALGHLHASPQLHQVIIVQLVLMVVLLFMLTCHCCAIIFTSPAPSDV